MHLIQTTARGRQVALLAIAAGVAIAACGGSGSDSGGGIVDPPVTLTKAWLGFGSDPQHTAVSQVATQQLSRIVWKTPVDLAPQYSSRGYLFYHYGSPVITAKNTVIVPVKRAVDEVYRVDARSGQTGAVVWTLESDYMMPDHHWTPSYNVTLTGANRVYAPGGGGKVYYRDNADSADSATQTKVFYGDAVYAASKGALDATVFINTPITADSRGNIYFGFTATPDNPAGLQGGIARIGADGTGSWAAAARLTGDSATDKAAMNSAPALSNDQKTLYVAVNGTSSTKGYLLALDAATLQVKGKALLVDPQAQEAATISDDGTASPMVGPDGDVYMGVLETTYQQHNARGWLLHFDASLGTAKTPGSFGWDDTPSVVPASMVPSYSGSSKYLLTIKYNNYARAGTGDSKNKVAVLDPNASQPDPIVSSVAVMKEVLTVLGQTADPNHPEGVLEWCINTAAVDPFTKSVIVNSEDGFLYRWDLTTNTLTEKIRLDSGRGESYTPTAIGPDGTVYAINNAVLFAIGK
ncbi:MAG: hypothetical protein ACJ8LG_20380 [Massilia sp.]